MTTHRTVIALVGLLVALPATAGEWYAGAKVARGDVSPDLVFITGSVEAGRQALVSTYTGGTITATYADRSGDSDDNLAGVSIGYRRDNRSLIVLTLYASEDVRASATEQFTAVTYPPPTYAAVTQVDIRTRYQFSGDLDYLTLIYTGVWPLADSFGLYTSAGLGYWRISGTRTQTLYSCTGADCGSWPTFGSPTPTRLRDDGVTGILGFGVTFGDRLQARVGVETLSPIGDKRGIEINSTALWSVSLGYAF